MVLNPFFVAVSIVLFGVLLLVFSFVGLCYDVVDRDHVRMSHDGTEVQVGRKGKRLLSC